MSSISVRFNSFLSLIRFSMNINPFLLGADTIGWSVWMDSNHRPHAYQACALATWATNRFFSHHSVPLVRVICLVDTVDLVEMMGFEPMTPCLQGRCSPSWATPPYLRVCSFSMINNNRYVVSDPWKLNNKSSIQASLKTSLVNRLRDLREKISWSP